MFIGRNQELEQLAEQLNQRSRTAVLVYGKRRVGKSTLIGEAARKFDGIAIHHLCVQSSYEGNLELLYRSVSRALGLPMLKFEHLYDLFDFLKLRTENILLILDEYQYLKETKKRNEVDSYLQNIIDSLPENVKIVLCGSYISIMKELLNEENPLFGRFTMVLHVEDFDYYDAAKFFPDVSTRKKIEFYSVFGGSPYILSNLDADATVEENVKKLVLSSTSLFRTYIENIVLREIQKAYDVRIFEVIGNGKKRYSEIKSAISEGDNGLLDKQLKNLIAMEAIEKIYPINKPNDKKKQFYTIKDNLVRFYFSFIFGNESLINKFGTDAFFEQEIRARLKTFISLRFEGIVCQYFMRCARNNKLKDVLDFGTFWYDNAREHTNGQFDCVLRRADGYDFYECKFYEKPMTLPECEQEEAQLREMKGLIYNHIGFVCSAGFNFETDRYDLLDADELYELYGMEDTA